MMVRSLLLALPPLLIGLAVTALAWPGPLRRQPLLKLFLGVGVGFGVDSCLYYAWSLLFHPAQRGFLVVEGVALAGLLAALLWLKRPARASLSEDEAPPRRLAAPGLALAALFVAAWALFAASFLVYTFLHPLGSYDAFGIWNLRARLILSNAADWKIAFSPVLYWNIHPDYPLLVTGSVTRLWALLGQMTPRAPIIVAGLFTFSLAGLLFSGLAQLRDAGHGALAGLLLLGTPALLLLSGSQTAEIPLAYYLLAVAVLLLLYGRSRRPAFLFLAGLMAGFAAWTKNEGLLFLAALCISLVCVSIGKPLKATLRTLAPFPLGLLLPLAALLAFKLTLAPANDLFAGQTAAGILAKLSDPARYSAILAAARTNLLAFGRWSFPILPLLLGAGVLLFNGVRPQDRWGLAVLLLSSVLTLAGYFGVYLITPHPLSWHLTNSLDRLLFHFFPVFLLALFLLTRSFDEALASLV